MLLLFSNRGAIIVRILNRYTKISLSTYNLLQSSVIFAINCYRGEYRLVYIRRILTSLPRFTTLQPSEVMKKASKPKVERVNRFEGKAAGDFLDIMMGEIFSPSRFFIQVRLIL